MDNNQIIFNIKDGKVKVSMRKPIGLPDFIQVIQTGILSALKSLLESADNKEKAKEELFNLYNTACSNTLHYFAPEYDFHPDLTAEAILRAENQIIDERYREMKRGGKNAGA